MSRARNVGDMEEKGRRDDCILFSVKSGESPTNYCFDSMKKIARFSPTILEVSSEAQCTYVVSSGIEGSWIYCFVRSILIKYVFTNDFDSCADILKLEDLKILKFMIFFFFYDNVFCK